MTKKTKLLLALALFIGVVAALVILFWPSNEPNAKISEPVKEARIAITKDGFRPSTLTVEPGTTITWVNEDEVAHRVVSGVYPDTKGSVPFDSGKDTPLGPEDVFSTTFSQTGSYDYYDHGNPTTVGRIIVETGGAQ